VGKGVEREETSKSVLCSASTIAGTCKQKLLSMFQRESSLSTVGRCVGREEVCCKTSACEVGLKI
jgi:hypothetical protein